MHIHQCSHLYSVDKITPKLFCSFKELKEVINDLRYTFQNMDIKGCTPGAPTHFKQEGALCYCMSDEAGNFVFQSVPVGKYHIVSVTATEHSSNLLCLHVCHTERNMQSPV